MAFCPMCGGQLGAQNAGMACGQCGHALLATEPRNATSPIAFPALRDVEIVELDRKKNKHKKRPLLVVRGLVVEKPDGGILLNGVDLTLQPGEVIVLLGPSGAGKTTLGRVFLEPESLKRAGFVVDAEEVTVDGSLGLVPQRGALFDHLDIAGNIRIALRYADDSPVVSHDDVLDWLRRVDLDDSLGEPGVPVAMLSGGQAQRVAVARTLAGGKKVLFLDEPSVGLDSARVRLLARQLRQQVETQRVAAVVVTHDLAFAVGVADRMLLLDGTTGKLVTLFPGEWPGPFDSGTVRLAPEKRGPWLARLEEELVARLEVADDRRHRERRSPRAPRVRRILDRLLLPFSVAGSAVIDGSRQLTKHPADFFAIFLRVIRQALLRPLLFYAVVSILLGFTVLYVISGVAPAGVQPEKAIGLLGSSHIVALVPPVGAFLFVAASGNAVNGWLGGMSLTKQIAALEALGINRRRYLWGPSLAGLFVASVVVSMVLAAGMVVGGACFCSWKGIEHGWQILTTDFSDPRPERLPYLLRGFTLLVVYAVGIACDVVAAGTTDKGESDQVTRAMTGSVVRCTLWVVTLELISTFIARSS